MHLSSKAIAPVDRALPWIVALLMAIAYGPLLLYWVDGWVNKSISIEHEYFSYGLIGLPFAAYLAWSDRRAWQRLPDATHPAGLGLLALAAVGYLSGVPDAVNLSFPLALAGICLSWKGWPGLKRMGFPLLFVLLATPNEIPYLIAPHTLWLQRFIAGTAGFVLTQFGLDVTVEGIYIYVGGRIVEVAPYCAGLKMLLTSFYVSLMVLYWTGAIASRAKSVLLVGGAIAISVVANIFRNTLLTFFHGTGRDGLFHWLHEGWGGDLYSAAMLGAIVLLMVAIDRVAPALAGES